MIAAGFGFRDSATAESLESALAAAWPGRAVDRLAVPADKARATAITVLAARSGLPLIAVDAPTLAAQPALTPAPAAGARYGWSPAETAALAAAGPGARLQAPRAVSADRLATCAIAIAAENAP
ncbi:MAG: cobalamin biosynthesis protein [Pseudomonadota bacterium]